MLSFKLQQMRVLAGTYSRVPRTRTQKTQLQVSFFIDRDTHRKNSREKRERSQSVPLTLPASYYQKGTVFAISMAHLYSSFALLVEILRTLNTTVVFENAYQPHRQCKQTQEPTSKRNKERNGRSILYRVSATLQIRDSESNVLDRSRLFQLRENPQKGACLRGQVAIRCASQRRVEKVPPRPPTPPGQVAAALNNTVPARAERASLPRPCRARRD